MSEFIDLFVAKYNYWGCFILMMIGIYAMIAKKNLVKKIIGLSIMQSATILFYVSISAKFSATIPIIVHHEGDEQAINALDYINPLPHVLMLTAIVVSVATLGVALALAIKIYNQHKTLEEDEVLAQIGEASCET